MRTFRNVAAVASLFESHRHLQDLEIPDYTSPPTEKALAATPKAFREDSVIEEARELDAKGLCGVPQQNGTTNDCQIVFPPPSSTTELGVVFYGGGLVDPRAYSPVCQLLTERYGLSVVVPIFADDLAIDMDKCDSGRIPLAQKAFPQVRKWVLAGHSLGGVAAAVDFWTAIQNNSIDETGLAGLVFLASYIVRDLCGFIDFSNMTFPAASVQASLDGVINWTNVEIGKTRLPANDTFFLDILGGNHQQFGSYDDSERFEILNSTRVDGNATIPESVLQDLVAAAIAHVASRSGLPLVMEPNSNGIQSQSTSLAPKRASFWLMAYGTVMLCCIRMLL